MVKSIFITLGWSMTPVVSTVVRHGVGEGDELVVLVPTFEDEQAKKAVNDLQGLVQMITGVKFQKVVVPVTDFVEAVAAIKNELDERAGRSCVVNLSGGMRILVLAAYLACMLSKARVAVEIEAENRAFVAELPVFREWVVHGLPPNAMRLLRILRADGDDAVSLRKRVNAPPSTFHEYVTALEKAGLVTRERRKKSYLIKPTKLGELVSMA